MLKVRLTETDLTSRPAAQGQTDRAEDDWLYWKFDGNIFSAYGDPDKLSDLIVAFRCWLERVEVGSLQPPDELCWLENWYAGQCNGQWEHCYIIEMETTTRPGWKIMVELDDTPLEMKELAPVEFHPNESSWLSYSVQQNRRRGSGAFFEASGDLRKLDESLKAFKAWAEE